MTNFEIIDAVQRSLESEGLLQSIRAQLRAGVFRIISDGPDYVPKANKVDSFSQNESGKQSLLLVKNLLETLGLAQSLSVFLAETGLETDASAHYGLAKQLNLGVPSTSQPILERLVISHEAQKGSSSPVRKNSPDAKPSRYDSSNNSFNDSKTGSRYDESKSLSPNKSLNISASVYNQPSGLSSGGNSPKIGNATSYDFNEVPNDGDDDFVPEEINESLAESEEDDEKPLQQSHRSPQAAAAESKAVSAKKPDSPKKGYFDDEAEDEEEDEQLSVADSPDASKNTSASFLHAAAVITAGDKKKTTNRLDESFEKSESAENSPVSKLTSGNSRQLSGKLEPVSQPVRAALPPLTKTKPVNMDASSSFEAEASNNSVKHTTTTVVKSPPKRVETKSPEPEEIEEESEGPEVDDEEEGSDGHNTSDEVDQLAESEGKLKFNEAMQYHATNNSSKEPATSERRIEIKSKLEPLPAVTAEQQPVSTNKARVNRMAQSSISRATKGWNVEADSRNDDFADEEEDNVDQLSESFSKRKNTNNDSMDVRDMSDDNIEEHKSSPMAKYDRKQPTGVSNNSSAGNSSSSNGGKSTSAWGNNRLASSSANNNKKPQLDASFEEEDPDDRNPAHTSYRSNQDEDEEEEEDNYRGKRGGGHNDSDEVVLEQSDEEYSEDNQYSFAHDKSKKEDTRSSNQAFVRRTDAPKASAAPAAVEEEPEEEDYGDEDFEDDDVDRSNGNIRHQSAASSSSKPSSAAAASVFTKKPAPAPVEEDDYEDDIEEEIEEDVMSVGQNSDEESDSDNRNKSKQQQQKPATTSLFNKSGLSRSGQSGALPGINSSTNKGGAASGHNPNRYFDNNSDEEEEDLNNTAEITKRMGDIDKKLANMEKSDSTLANLRKNIDNNDSSEVISESMSVASEDIDVMEFSAGGDHPESDDGF